MNRRVFLRTSSASGAAVLTGLTGCLGGGGDDERSIPDVSFGASYESTGDGRGIADVQHEGGDDVEAGKLSIRGDGIVSVPRADQTDRGPWQGETNDVGMVTEGDSLALGVAPDYEITIVFQARRVGVPVATISGPDS